jgi:hypothetical protein
MFQRLFNRFCTLLLFVLLIGSAAQAQSVIFSENVGVPSATTLVNVYTGWQNNGLLTFTNGGQPTTSDARTSNASSGYAGASAGGNVFFTGVGSAVVGFAIEGINVSNYVNLTLDYAYRKESSTAHAPFAVDFWNGTAWVSVASTAANLFNEATTAATGWYLAKTLSLPAAAQINGLKLRFTRTGTNTLTIRIDDIVLKGIDASGPVIIPTTSSFNGSFGVINVGSSSASSSFTVQGANLTTPLVVTPPAGFEIRTGTNAFSTNPISFTPAAGAVPVTSIDVRFTPPAYNRYTGNVTCTSAGATTINIPVSGNGAIKNIAVGNWSSPSTWDGGIVPNATQNVYINSAFPVTIDIPNAECKTIDFDAAGTSGLLIMGSSTSGLDVYGDFNLGNTTQMVFNTWPAGAKLRFKGNAASQTITGLNTGTTNSAGIMELVIDKSTGKLTTAGNNSKLTIGTSLEVVSGTFELGLADDIFGRDQAGATTLPTLTIQSAGTFTIVSGGASQINAGSGSSGGKIGKMTIHGMAELSTTSSVGIQFSDVDVELGGTLRLMPNWFTSSTIGFNSGTITVKSGGTLRYSTTSTVLWSTASAVIMNDGSILNITTITAPTLAPTFTDNGATWRYNFAGNQDGVGVSARSVKNLELSGGGIKTLAAAVTVNGLLSITETSSLSLGTGTLTYGSGSTLQYGSATQVDAQTTSINEWPATGSVPPNVKVQNTGGLTLDATKTISGNLELAAGVVTLGNNSLSVASVTGGSASNYVATTGTGVFTVQSVGSNAVNFPVGNGSYTPVSVSNSGTSDDLSVNVSFGTPCDVNALNSVNRIWTLTEGTPGGSNATIGFLWNASEENFGFTRSMINAVRCNGAAVDLVGQAAAASGSGPYTGSISGVTAFGPFGITNSVNDISLTALVAPVDGGCKTSTETVTVTIKNNSSFPVDLSKNNVTVTVTATGGYNSTVVLNTGTLLANGTQNVNLPATIDMSAGGSFTFNASATIPGDVNTANDALAAVTLTASAQPTASISYAGTPYCASLVGAQPVTFTGTTGGGFSSTAGLTIDAATGSVTPSSSTAGTYTVIYSITATNGCNAVSATAPVVINALRDATFNYGATNTFCQTGSNPTATITGTVGGTFTSAPAGLSIDVNTGAINLAASALNSYTVTYTTPGPCAESLTLNIAVTSAPSANFTYASTSYCSNGTNPTPVFGAGASGGVFSAMPAGLSINSTTGEINLSASTPGTYTVNNSIAASGGCASASANATITVTALPQASISYAGAPYCIGNTSNQSATLSGTTGGTFTSSPTGLSISSSTGAVLPSGSTPGTYTVSYTLAAGGGCPAVTATTSLIINPLPAANISYSGAPFCNSLSVPQSVTQSGTLGGAYSAAPSGLSIDPTTGSITPSASTPGTYTVTYSVAATGGCTALNVTTSVTITATPSATFSYAGTPFCASLTNAQAVSLTGTTGGVFSAPAGLVINASTGAITPSASTPGTYTVTYSIAASGGCAAFSTTSNVTITAVPQASILYASSPFCTTVITPQPVSLTGVGGGVYSASPAGLNLNANTGTIAPSTSTPGSYTISYTIPAIAGCPTRDVTTPVTITPAPTATISYTATPYCQGSGLATVTRTGSSGGAYSSTAGLVINASTGEINLNTSTPGTYTITYSIAASGGCAAFSTTATITINALSVAATSATVTPTSFCGPTNITLRTVGGTLAPGASWVWYSGSCGGTRVGTGATLALTGISATTTYFVRAEGGTCANSACVSTAVTINTVPAIQIDVLGDTSLLPGKTCTLIATANPLNAANTFAWFLNGTQVAGATASSLIVDVDKVGLYTVRVTTPSGCSTTSIGRRINAAASAQVWIAPNPSTGRFQVRFYSRATVFNFKRTLLVYDTRGVLVHSVTVPITGPYSTIDVDLTAKPRGMYFLFLRKENEEKLGAGRIFLY